LTVAVVASVEVDVGMGEDAEEGSETEVASEVVEVAAASEAVMTMDHREVEVAIGAEVAVWATKVDSTTVHLPTGMEDLLDPAVGPVVQVGMVLLAGVLGLVPPAAVVLADLEVIEDISSERAQEVTTTETQSGHGTRFVANCTPPGEV